MSCSGRGRRRWRGEGLLPGVRISENRKERDVLAQRSGMAVLFSIWSAFLKQSLELSYTVTTLVRKKKEQGFTTEHEKQQTRKTSTHEWLHILELPCFNLGAPHASAFPQYEIKSIIIRIQNSAVPTAAPRKTSPHDGHSSRPPGQEQCGCGERLA